MNVIEIFAVITTLLSVIFSIKNNILTWPIGIVSNFLYMYLFYDLNIFGNMVLQVLFILQAVYGWYKWKYDDNVKISKLPDTLLVKGTVLAIALNLMFIMYLILTSLDDKSPIFDSITTTLCLIAVTLLSLKKIETWYFWILSDVIFIWFFIEEGLYLSSLIYLIILILAITGLTQWKKDLKTA